MRQNKREREREREENIKKWMEFKEKMKKEGEIRPFVINKKCLKNGVSFWERERERRMRGFIYKLVFMDEREARVGRKNREKKLTKRISRNVLFQKGSKKNWMK